MKRHAVQALDAAPEMGIAPAHGHPAARRRRPMTRRAQIPAEHRPRGQRVHQIDPAPAVRRGVEPVVHRSFTEVSDGLEVLPLLLRSLRLRSARSHPSRLQLDQELPLVRLDLSAVQGGQRVRQERDVVAVLRVFRERTPEHFQLGQSLTVQKRGFQVPNALHRAVRQVKCSQRRELLQRLRVPHVAVRYVEHG